MIDLKKIHAEEEEVFLRNINKLKERLEQVISDPEMDESERSQAVRILQDQIEFDEKILADLTSDPDMDAEVIHLDPELISKICTVLERGKNDNNLHQGMRSRCDFRPHVKGKKSSTIKKERN